MNTNASLETFLGKRAATVLHEDGSKEEVNVTQLRLAQYEDAMKHMDDEFALVGFMCGKDRKWALSLAPDSYEVVESISRELNVTGFFRYAGRRLAMRAVRASLTPQSPSETSSSALPPRPR